MKVSRKKGMSPGSVVFVGEKKLEDVRINIIKYDLKEIYEKKGVAVGDCGNLVDSKQISWIDIAGLHDVEAISEIGNIFDIHPLVLEDIVNTNQRPKIEIFDDYIFIVFKMLSYNYKDSQIESEQVSLVVSGNRVISFQEMEGDVLDSLRERIRHSKGRVRGMKGDYLAYAILDIVVDHYFEVLEKIGEEMEIVEQELMKKPEAGTLSNIYRLKREIQQIKKSVWPLREVVSRLEKGDVAFVERKTEPYLRDLYDHIIQIIDNIESMRDVATGLLDLYLSSVSFRMNDVMKVLTIISTIFIPLTFIAGIYGMNFENMPELGWKSGYFIILGIMFAVSALMIFFFKKKKWW
jgi:magnesium transporter